MTVADRVEIETANFVEHESALRERSCGAGLSLAETGANPRTPRRAWMSQRLVYRWTAAVTDLVLVTAFAMYVVSGRGTDLAGPSFFAGYLLPFAVGLVFAVTVGLNHGYDTRRAASGLHEFRALGAGMAALTVSVLLIDFIGLVELEVLPSLIGLALIGVSVTIVRLTQRSIARLARSHGYFRKRTLVIGPAEQVSTVLRDLDDAQRHGFHVVGVCLPDDDMDDRQVTAELPVWGTVAEAAGMAVRHEIDAVVVSASAMDVDELRRFRWAVERTQVEVLIAPNLNEVLADRVSLQAVSATPLLTVTSGPSRAQRLVKGVMDRVLAAALLVVFAPVIGAAALAVRLTSPGGAVFRQTRIGVDGKPFVMLKLRSMVADAEHRRAELEEVGNKGDGAQFKLAADPRITPVGKFIRRFSIDELPQLWNVVRGDMSLVGPRPPLPTEVATYDAMAVHRLHVKPGLTGLWQVSGRSDLSWEESVRLDLRYVDNFSLLRDVQILWRTARAVLGAHGAY